VRNLLNHTSGLPDCKALFVRDGRVSGNWSRSIQESPDSYEPTAIDALHLLERQPKLLFEPGTKFSRQANTWRGFAYRDHPRIRNKSLSMPKHNRTQTNNLARRSKIQ